MHFQTSLSMAVVALITAVKADFEIYSYTGQDVFGADWEGYQIFDGPPSCDDVRGTRTFGDYADVSDVSGIRCDGCGDGNTIRDPWEINELEINGGGDWGHYTIYRGEGFQLTPRDGGPLRGSCVQDTGNDFTCPGGVATGGIRIFICTSDLGAPPTRG